MASRLKTVTDPHYTYEVRGKVIEGSNYVRVAVPPEDPQDRRAQALKGWGELLRFLMKENLPGHYPYTGGVYPYRRTGEDPTRMFAGEGTPERTNRRFHYLSPWPEGRAAVHRLRFRHPIRRRPGKRARTSTARWATPASTSPTLDDMKKLYSGFDLCAPTTSVSMTINGPAPMILAMFMNTAIDQQVEKYLKEDPETLGGRREEDRRTIQG